MHLLLFFLFLGCFSWDGGGGGEEEKEGGRKGGGGISIERGEFHLLNISRPNFCTKVLPIALSGISSIAPRGGSVLREMRRAKKNPGNPAIRKADLHPNQPPTMPPKPYPKADPTGMAI